MDSQVVILLCTVPDSQVGERLCKDLLENKHIACCNVVPVENSFYMWEGKLNNDQEKLLVMKTFERKIKDIEEYLYKHHPYSCPEIVALNTVYVGEKYLKWMNENIQ